MFLLIVFIVVVVALFYVTRGTFGPSLVSSVHSLINTFFADLGEIKEIEKEIADELDSITKTEDEVKEVFHVHNQMFTYDEAKAFCKEMGVRLATLNDVKRSYLEGAQWHTMGWSDGQLGLFVLQPGYVRRHPSAGDIGVNGGYFHNPKVRMGINCYGVKPKPDPARIEYSYSELERQMGIDGRPMSRDVHGRKSYAQMLKDGDIVISPWNSNKWSIASKKKSHYLMYGTGTKHHHDTVRPDEVLPSHKKESKIHHHHHTKESKIHPSSKKPAKIHHHHHTMKPVKKSGLSGDEDTKYSQAVASLSRSYLGNIISKQN